MFIQQLVQLTINLESPHISHFVVAKSPYLGIRAFLVVDISFYSFLKSHDQLVYSKVMEKMVKSLGSWVSYGSFADRTAGRPTSEQRHPAVPAPPAPVPPLGSQAAPQRWQPWGWRSAAVAPKQAMCSARSLFSEDVGFEPPSMGNFTREYV